jgi:hypothetical protein
VLCDTHPEQRHEHDAQGGKRHERRHHVREERGDAGARQLVLHADRHAVARVDFGELHRGQRDRQRPHDEQRIDEQQRRVWQLVAGAFDEVQKAIEAARGLGARLVRCHG